MKYLQINTVDRKSIGFNDADAELADRLIKHSLVRELPTADLDWRANKVIVFIRNIVSIDKVGDWEENNE